MAGKQAGMTFQQALEMVLDDSRYVMVRHVGVGADGLAIYCKLDRELETGTRRFGTQKINWDVGAILSRADLTSEHWALLSEDRLVVGETA